MHRLGIIISSIVLIITAGLLAQPFIAQGQTADELQKQIEGHNATIKALEDEIAKYQVELNKTSAEAKTLQSAVTTLDVSSKKLSTDLNLTENKIQSTDLTIKSLKNQITDKEARITQTQKALAESMRKLNESDNRNLIELLLQYNNMSDFWDEVITIDAFQEDLQDHIGALRGLKSGLESNKSDNEVQKDKLQSLKDQLADQRKLVEDTKKQKASLLTQTKSQESAYKALIAEKKKKQQQFAQELTNFEAQLKITIDPSSYADAKSGALAWPIDNAKITQTFGDTEFSRVHAAVYNGNGHNGIDIGAPIGTPIKSAAGGTVLGVGDTDTACPNASYGKWVFVEHPNGLSTLYAHMSVVKAVKGQTVKTGDVLGYVGMTGYATGPHLHFTVYASQGVQIQSRASKSCNGRVYTMPIADLKAYLNPMNYL